MDDHLQRLFIHAQKFGGWVVGDYIEKVLFPLYEKQHPEKLQNINICLWFDRGTNIHNFLVDLKITQISVTRIKTIAGCKLNDKVSYFKYNDHDIHLLSYSLEELYPQLLLSHHNITYDFVEDEFEYISHREYYPVHHPIKSQLINVNILSYWTPNTRDIIFTKILKYIKNGWTIHLDELTDYNLPYKDDINNYLSTINNYMETGFTPETWEMFSIQLDKYLKI